MNERAIRILGFDKIKEKLSAHCLSDRAKTMMQHLQPSTDLAEIQRWLQETTEARMILDERGSVPLHGLAETEPVIEKLGKGLMLHPEQLTTVMELIRAGQKLKRCMRGQETSAPRVSSYGNQITELEEVASEIERCIRHGRVDDQASRALAKARKKRMMLEERIKSKLGSLLKSPAYRNLLQDGVVSMREGRYVIPIKAEHRRNIEGQVWDRSASGQTVFIEPEEIKILQNECNQLKIEEEMEEQRILAWLTGMVEARQREIEINIETLAFYDYLFAKAKYSREINGRTVSVNAHKHIHIKGGRHPLIGESAIPLDFVIGDRYSTLVITGPNTGGKTVTIKTVGLMTQMVQAGLHVPVNEGSRFAVFEDVLVDIGDGQSIEQSLSTFSAHIRNMISILQSARPHTLVIVDELGSGTDPQEGMGLAISILEELDKKGATVLATTHYSEIKEYAETRERFENGSMEFDLETLRPLYRLRIGSAGDSQAFSIALRLGMDIHLIERAHEITYKGKNHVAPTPHRLLREQDASVLEGLAKEQMELQTELQVGRQTELETELQLGMQTNLQTELQTKPLMERKVAPPLEQRGEKQPVQPNDVSIHQPSSPKPDQYAIGDEVYLLTWQTSGIVCEPENQRGELGVMVGHKRWKVHKSHLTCLPSENQ